MRGRDFYNYLSVQLAFFRDDLTNLSTVSMGRFPMFLYP